jgi:hypothetical protein
VGLERGPFSFVSTTEELLGRKNSGSGLENREYGRRDPLCWPRNTLYPQNLALTSPTSGGSSVGTVRSRTQATEFSLLFDETLRNLQHSVRRCFTVQVASVPSHRLFSTSMQLRPEPCVYVRIPIDIWLQH